MLAVEAQSAVNDSLFAVGGRLGDELLTLAPVGLEIGGYASGSKPALIAGAAMGFLAFLTNRSKARAAELNLPELPAQIGLPANGGGSWIIHTAVKMPGNAPIYRMEVKIPE
jgi:hypothetical protein